MRIAIVGAGNLGSFLAAHLTQAGHPARDGWGLEILHEAQYWDWAQRVLGEGLPIAQADGACLPLPMASLSLMCWHPIAPERRLPERRLPCSRIASKESARKLKP